MNKLNDFRVNRLIIFFSDQAYDLTSDIWGTNSQPNRKFRNVDGFYILYEFRAIGLKDFFQIGM